jgi:hypothetical protein
MFGIIRRPIRTRPVGLAAFPLDLGPLRFGPRAGPRARLLELPESAWAGYLNLPGHLNLLGYLSYLTSDFAPASSARKRRIPWRFSSPSRQATPLLARETA